MVRLLLIRQLLRWQEGRIRLAILKNLGGLNFLITILIPVARLLHFPTVHGHLDLATQHASNSPPRRMGRVLRRSGCDAKLKENIIDAGSQWSDLKALQVRKYNFKESQTHTQIGLVAQEVELVSPGLVSESPDRDKDGNDLGTVTKSVNYSVLYMKAVKALQEAMERIEALEASNTGLLARVTALESA
jgi:hypothetical protein